MPPGEDEPPVLRRHPLDDDLGRGLVPVVAAARVVGEALRRRLRLEITDVGREGPAAEHELAAGQVFVPARRQLPPGVGPLVMETPRAHGHAGPAVDPGLHRIAVEDEAVDAVGEGAVAEGLDRGRMLQPLLAVARGERLGAEDGLAVGVHGGGHALDRLERAAAHPELAHRLVGLAGVGQVVAGAAVGLDGEAQAAGAGQLAEAAGVILDDELGDRPAQVPQEALGDLQAPDDPPREDRQIGVEVVAAALGEFGRHRRGPVLRAVLPAVDVRRDEDLAGRRARVGDELLHHAAVVGLDPRSGELVALEAAAAFRRRGVLDARRGVAETHDGPLSGRNVPGQAAVRVQPLLEVDDPRRVDDLRGGQVAPGGRPDGADLVGRLGLDAGDPIGARRREGQDRDVAIEPGRCLGLRQGARRTGAAPRPRSRSRRPSASTPRA